MLVISVSLFLGFVWPSISESRLANELYAKKQNDLAQLDDKQQKIDSVSTKIKADTTSTQLVGTYLPKNRSEEQIISNVNYLATSAGVSLANISLTDSSPAVVQSDANVIPMMDESGQPIVTQVDPETLLKFSSAKISASGSYDNLQMFIDKLQHSGVYSKVKSFSVEKNKSTDGQATTLLVSDIVIDFGYLAAIKFDNNMLASFEPTFDSTLVKSLQDFVSQKNQVIDIGSTGKTNPFQQ
jgi:hypothetical protein